MEPDFKNAGRNDPCPCGSGKKYKRCHFQKDIIRKQAEETTVELSDFLKPDHDPYKWFKGLRILVNRRDWAVLYEAFASETPIRERYPTAEAFVAEARESSNAAPTGGDYELRRFHLLDDAMFIMGVRGQGGRQNDELEFEVIATVKTEEGYRITDIERRSIAKADEAEDLPFADFACFGRAVEAARLKPVDRPEFVRWTLDGPPPGFGEDVVESEDDESEDEPEPDEA